MEIAELRGADRDLVLRWLTDGQRPAQGFDSLGAVYDALVAAQDEYVSAATAYFSAGRKAESIVLDDFPGMQR
jgi:hypothetical protein